MYGTPDQCTLHETRSEQTRADQSRPEQSSPSFLLRVPLAGDTVRDFHPHLEPSLPDFPSQAPPCPLPSTLQNTGQLAHQCDQQNEDDDNFL